jgi:hypothetical protein
MTRTGARHPPAPGRSPIAPAAPRLRHPPSPLTGARPGRCRAASQRPLPGAAAGLVPPARSCLVSTAAGPAGSRPRAGPKDPMTRNAARRPEPRPAIRRRRPITPGRPVAPPTEPGTVPSPGGWTAPPKVQPGWNWGPPHRIVPRTDRAPGCGTTEPGTSSRPPAPNPGSSEPAGAREPRPPVTPAGTATASQPASARRFPTGRPDRAGTADLHGKPIMDLVTCAASERIVLDSKETAVESLS